MERRSIIEMVLTGVVAGILTTLAVRQIDRRMVQQEAEETNNTLMVSEATSAPLLVSTAPVSEIPAPAATAQSSPGDYWQSFLGVAGSVW